MSDNGRAPRMSNFLRGLIAVTALIHIPFALAVFSLTGHGVALSLRTRILVSVFIGCAGVIPIYLRARSGLYDTRKNDLRVRFVDVPYFIHWCASVFATLIAPLYLLSAPIVSWVTLGIPRVSSEAFLWMYGAGLVVSSYGILYRRRAFLVKKHEIRVRGLDRRLDGFTIAHLSDLHIGSFTPRSWGLKWIARANQCRPDLAVVTGDLATSGTAYYDDIVEVVGALEAKRGTIVSMGNHDYFGDGEPLIRGLEGKGIRVLRNEGFVIDVDGGEMFIAGVDDTWTRRANLQKAFEGRPVGATSLLLAHDPALFDDASELHASLVLSGHTHGGQIAIPYAAKRYSLSMFAHTYNLGFYRRGDSILYVHPGLGTTGPPIRIGVAPAVVLLTLRSG